MNTETGPSGSKSTESGKVDPHAYGQAFARWKTHNRPQPDDGVGYCSESVLRFGEKAICGHPLYGDAPCANSSVHLS